MATYGSGVQTNINLLIQNLQSILYAQTFLVDILSRGVEHGWGEPTFVQLYASHNLPTYKGKTNGMRVCLLSLL